MEDDDIPELYCPGCAALGAAYTQCEDCEDSGLVFESRAEVAVEEDIWGRVRRVLRGLPRVFTSRRPQPTLGADVLLLCGDALMERGRMGIVTDIHPKFVSVTQCDSHGNLVTKKRSPSSLVVLEPGLEGIQSVDGSLIIQRRVPSPVTGRPTTDDLSRPGIVGRLRRPLRVRRDGPVNGPWVSDGSDSDGGDSSLEEVN